MNSIPMTGRLGVFPTGEAPLEGPAVIRWDDHQIPFIEAGSDADAAFLLGAVHAHLRLGQMEFLRRVSQARLAETGGPFLVDIDHTLRALDLGRAVPAIKASMRPDTLAWVERYVEGINWYASRTERPPELGLLGFEAEAWTVEDVLRLGRLASADVNWLLSYTFLRLRKEEGFPAYWKRVLDFGAGATPSFGPGSPGAEAGSALDLLGSLGRSGSNAVVVSGSRSVSGAGLVAADPHVGVNLPALWTIVGYSTPGTRVLGFTIAGLPAVVVGRNEKIAWAGTNMIGLNSSMYDVSSMRDRFTTREETIRVRLWFDREVEITETPMGPLMSGTPLFKDMGLPPTALKWRGHEASDEISTFLDVSRSGTFEEFRAAFAPYAVSGQNFLYADSSGNIGQVLAMEYDPAAGRVAPLLLGDPTNPEHVWGNPIRSTELPFAYNPGAGVLISANNTPVKTEPPVTLVTNANDRMDRFAELLGLGVAAGAVDGAGGGDGRDTGATSMGRDAADRIDVDRLKAIQQDVVSLASRTAAGLVAERAGDGGALDVRARAVVEALRAWDGAYAIDSTGASAYQFALVRIAGVGWEKLHGAAIARSMLGSPAVHHLFVEDLRAGVLDRFIADGLMAAGKDFIRRPFSKGVKWGEIHRLRLATPVGRAPVIGSKFRFGEDATAGSSTTIYKSAHTPTTEKHGTDYGANARFVADLSDADANDFSLLGGQDGWIGSENFLDLYQEWKRGGYVRVPLSEAGVRAGFTRVMEFVPVKK